MKDIIRLSSLSFYGYHGVSAAERETGGIFEVDCELELDFADAGASDRLSDTIDYAEVFSLIRDTVEGKAYALLERLATHLAALLLDKFAVYRVTLKVRKMRAPIAGHIGSIEVEVSRYQSDPSRLMDNSI
ncbi:MAG: dihydroneopterin aldolase [candidate division Zixibacteria bacterium]|nr:dihydroneopterin aldolase [candidate division Zixibacteria bacterium]